MRFEGRAVYPGVVEGRILLARHSVPGWNAFSEEGTIAEVGNPLYGRAVAGRILVLNGSRGSTGWGTQFLKLRLHGQSPAALLFPRTDSRSAAACVVSRVPAVADFDQDLFSILNDGDMVRVDGNTGTVQILAGAAQKDDECDVDDEPPPSGPSDT